MRNEVIAMAIVYQKNKKTEITYVYQNEPYWDKEKRQSRAKRACCINTTE